MNTDPIEIPHSTFLSLLNEQVQKTWRPGFTQIYDHTDYDGVRRRIDVSRLLQDIVGCHTQAQLVEFMLDASLQRFLVTDNQTSPERARRLAETDFASRVVPPIVCLFDDGEQLIVDGSHRLLARCLEQETSTRVWLVEEKDWKPYLVPNDSPETVMDHQTADVVHNIVQIIQGESREPETTEERKPA